MNLGVCVVCEVEGMDTTIKQLNQEMVCKICASAIEYEAKADAEYWGNERKPWEIEKENLAIELSAEAATEREIELGQ